MARKKKNGGIPVVHAMQVRRLFLLATFMLAGFGCLGFRLYDLQVLRHEELLEQAKNNTERTFVRQPRRGDIRDIRGNLLATSKEVKTVCGDPHMLGTNYLYVARAIAPILDLPVEEAAEKLRPRMFVHTNGVSTPVKYVVLKNKVEEEEWLRLQEALSQVTFGVDESQLPSRHRTALNAIRRKAIFAQPDQLRFYPNASLAAHVLGFVGIHDRITSKGKVVETTGKSGLELTLNSVLTGVQGWRQTETDRRQREVVAFREQDVAPRAGLDAILTIDAGVQHIVEEELAEAMEKHTPISISCIVTRPRTGEILAMANLPTYDPNHLDDNAAARRNRAVTDLAEPGSTFKVVVISAALNEGLVNLETAFDCENGYWRYRGIPLRDHHGYGVLPVRTIISKSSNIGAAKIGILLGGGRLNEYIRAFGFGQRTGIPLPGEAIGLVHETNRWSKISISRIPMGHEISCTPLQMVMAMGAIANGGALMRPMLVDRFVDEHGQEVAKFQPQLLRQVISAEAARQTVATLKEAVSTNGTANRAQLDYYTVAGKTGTAQKLVNGAYVRNKHYSSFIGFFPADNPELCISVVMDEPRRGYYGGEAAAPVFQRIAARAANYLAIPPEITPPSLAASTRGAQ